MMNQTYYTISSNQPLTSDVFRMTLLGDTSAIKKPGQFINIRLNGLFLRRPISVHDADENGLTILYKVVGTGTKLLSEMKSGMELDALTGLGNGFDPDLSGKEPLLLGGGIGSAPLFMLAKILVSQGKNVSAVLGFNSSRDIICEQDFLRLGVKTFVTTADGSYGIKGYVTDAIPSAYSYFYACGPEPMLKAVYFASNRSGQLSFEERMGCGFGACMGCTCRTLTGYKRICRDGPVLFKEELLWEN